MNPLWSRLRPSKRDENRNKSWFLSALFGDPQYKFRGSFEDATKKAKNEEKWVLVNIQDAENFASLCLNRDVWKDPDRSFTLFMNRHFVFCQWEKKSENGKKFIDLYHPSSSYPHIFILNRFNRIQREIAVPAPKQENMHYNLIKGKIIEFVDWGQRQKKFLLSGYVRANFDKKCWIIEVIQMIQFYYDEMDVDL